MAHQPKIRADELVAPCQGDIGMGCRRSHIFGEAGADGILCQQHEFRRNIRRTYMEHVLYPWMGNTVVSGKGYQIRAAACWQAAEPGSCRLETGVINHDNGGDIYRQGREQVSDRNER